MAEKTARHYSWMPTVNKERPDGRMNYQEPLMGTRKAVVLQVLVLFASVPLVLAAEPVTFEKLQSYPNSYHAKVVTLQGTAHQVQILVAPPPVHPQLDFQCAFVHPAYMFVLADDTGFQQITVRARPPCVAKSSPAEPSDVAEGDTVAVDVQITVTSRSSEGSAGKTFEALAL
jgi:hypothetical protein